jgi:taurine--2-oxoglutarate transaminase
MRCIEGFRETYDVIRQFRSGQGCWLTDAAGRRFLDLSSQYWNVNLGHRCPELLEAIREGVGGHLFLSHRFGDVAARHELAARLDDVTGGRFPAVQFMASGSMAVEAAIKVAREVTGREGVLSLRQSYHGMSYGALNCTGCDGIVLPFGERDARHLFAEPFHCSLCPFGLKRETCGVRCVEEMEALIRGNARRLAAVVAEPVISNQVIVPPADFWPRISTACEENGVLLIADEVVSGLGRCGAWLGSDLVGMRPSLVALGKGMTGGFLPFAALLHGPRTASFYEGGRLLHGQTFDGYDLGCRAAIALIDTIASRGLIERVNVLGARLERVLVGLRSTIPQIHDVRGWGLLWGVEIAPDALADEEAEGFAVRLQDELAARGVLLGGLGRVQIFAPPFVIAEDELDAGVGLAGEAIAAALLSVKGAAR